MGRLKYYGACVRRGRMAVPLNKCFQCGTANPCLPGTDVPVRCAGCGAALMNHPTDIVPNANAPGVLPARMPKGVRKKILQQQAALAAWKNRDKSA